MLLHLAQPCLAPLRVMTLILLPEPEQGLAFAQELAAGFVFSQTDRFYPVQQLELEPYPLAE